jgi:hypothetical protein
VISSQKVRVQAPEHSTSTTRENHPLENGWLCPVYENEMRRSHGLGTIDLLLTAKQKAIGAIESHNSEGSSFCTITHARYTPDESIRVGMVDRSRSSSEESSSQSVQRLPLEESNVFGNNQFYLVYINRMRRIKRVGIINSPSVNAA